MKRVTLTHVYVVPNTFKNMLHSNYYMDELENGNTPFVLREKLIHNEQLNEHMPYESYEVSVGVILC